MARIQAQLNTGDERFYDFEYWGYHIPEEIWENPYSSLTSDISTRLAMPKSSIPTALRRNGPRRNV